MIQGSLVTSLSRCLFLIGKLSCSNQTSCHKERQGIYSMTMTLSSLSLSLSVTSQDKSVLSGNWCTFKSTLYYFISWWLIYTVLALLVLYKLPHCYWEKQCICVIQKTSGEISYLTYSRTYYLLTSLLESITYISQFELERKQSEFLSWSSAQIVGSTLNKSQEFSRFHFNLAQLLFVMFDCFNHSSVSIPNNLKKKDIKVLWPG